MYRRDVSHRLSERLSESRRFMQIVIGPRQTGKTTAIKQALQTLGMRSRVATADAAGEVGATWVELEWMQARRLAASGEPAVLVLDEIQKVDQWSETVKRLWDEDFWSDLPLAVVLSGPSSLLLRKGLTESLAGRFELLRSTHWSLREMSDAFGYELDDYLRFGGYPGTAHLRGDASR